MSWPHTLRLLVIVCLSLSSARAQAAADVLVTSLRGDARSGPAALKLLDQLPYQQRIEVADGAQLVLVDLQSAQQYSLRGPGQFVLQPDKVLQLAGSGSVQRKQLPAAYRGLRLDEGNATHAGAVLRDITWPSNGIWPGFPADQQEERIATQRATFSWPARPHKGTWQLRLVAPDGSPVYQANVTQNQTQLPETITLAPEQDYRLELEWRAPGGLVQSSSVPLRTLSSEQTLQLQALAPASDATAAETLLYVLWLRSKGVRSLAKTQACHLQTELC